MPRSVEDLLAEARRRLARLEPEEAFAEMEHGALLVDTRTLEQRLAQGDIPGSLLIDRTVFEWRLDPSSRWKIPEVVDHGTRIIVVCREGYSSSLAAATLQELGLRNATDVIGGFEAWRDADLPTEPCRTTI
jgi:rhodanese-related sulfurtransferase